MDLSENLTISNTMQLSERISKPPCCKLSMMHQQEATDHPLMTVCMLDPRLARTLLRFRLYQVAVTADIEKAFLMVSVAEEDRDALHFLWVEDMNSQLPRLVTLRFARVVFGVSSSHSFSMPPFATPHGTVQAVTRHL